jgi:hypothetical protein
MGPGLIRGVSGKEVLRVINSTLTTADFRNIPPGHQTAFGAGTVRVVNLPRGFMMFKLTAGKAPAHATYGITPWWSPVKPFMEDYEGALGRYEQAVLNGIDLSAMVRFMSAVCIDWNDLDNFVQVELVDDCRAFWGTFAPPSRPTPLPPPSRNIPSTAAPTCRPTSACSRPGSSMCRT